MRFAQFAAMPWSRSDLDRLTEEEEQVLMLRRRGKSIQQVASAMNMSPESVHRRQRSALHKLL